MNKSETVQVRMTPEYKEKLSNLANSLGISVSALILFTLGEKFGEKLADVIVDKK